MEWIETTGRSVAEAVDAALDELGVDEDDAEIVIVAEPKSGLFGLGRSEARIRARVRPSSPRPKRSQRDRSRSSRGGRPGAERAGREPRRGGSRAPKAAGADRPGRAKSPGGPSVGNARREQPDPAEPAANQTGAKRPRRRRGGRGRGNGRSGSAARPEGVAEEEAMTVEEQVDLVGAFVRGVVERFGYDATTTTRVEDDRLYVDVVGEDLGLLIGPHGSTLDALQELARTVVQRRGDERALRVVVDVAGFRARRAVALEAFTRRRAGEVLDTGVAEALEPMSAADRKIVHDTVASIDGLETGSEGVEPKRYVVIRPAAATAPETAPDED
ncbi:MAG: RNA-binding cell elongation regulator Jag/EloR [Acidimicrobiales bacterium]|jgi:spoIIIJ-associated protein